MWSQIWPNNTEISVNCLIDCAPLCAPSTPPPRLRPRPLFILLIVMAIGLIATVFVNAIGGLNGLINENEFGNDLNNVINCNLYNDLCGALTPSVIGATIYVGPTRVRLNVNNVIGIGLGATGQALAVATTTTIITNENKKIFYFGELTPITSNTSVCNSTHLILYSCLYS